MHREPSSPEPAPPIGPLATAHPTHDLLLVAAWASDDLDVAARTAAAELVAGCSACGALAADLRALAAATHDLPPAVRPRDFFLSPADAARLRPGGLRRLLAALAAPGALTRPLAAGLTTLGVAGLLVASLPGLGLPFGATGASAPMLEQVGDTAAPPDAVPPLAAPSAAPGAPSAAPGAPSGEDDRDTSGVVDGSGSYSGPPGSEQESGGGTGGSGEGAGSGAGGPDSPDGPTVEPLTQADDGGPSVLVVLSGSFLIVGLGLFALRWTGRRLGSG